MVGHDDKALADPSPALWRSMPSAIGLVASLVFVGATVLLGHLLHETLPPASHSLIFLTAVVLSAVGFGFWAGLFAAALAFLAYNFFFVEPVHTLSVARPEDILALSVFLLVAALIGLLAGRMREEAMAAYHRAATLELLSAFSEASSRADAVDAVEGAMVGHLRRIDDGRVVLLRVQDDRLAIVRTEPADVVLRPMDFHAADRAQRYGAVEPATAAGWEGSQFSFHPVMVGGAVRAVIGIERGSNNRRFAHENDRVVASILRHGAVAIERLVLARTAQEAREKADRESLRSALLTSLSHDLRTPLATILGSVTSLRQLGETLPAEARADLLLAIEEETGRLSRYVSNLLHMTRLQSGLDPRLDWIDPADVTHGAVERARSAYPGRDIAFRVVGAVPLIHCDAALLEQALVNIIDNAVKFSPLGMAVEVLVTTAGKSVRIGVTDRGEGISEPDRDRIFETFYRGSATKVPGTGLGLTICKGIVQALGGAIRAESPVEDGHGTTVLVDLPAPEPASS
jgi:two-component system sensor histidine kinase KdpD